ncbi:MAG: alpha/beta hydrolase [Candidatus Limivivens sp.]|nr:alpha/beta hydrolase [Candidatus Limivivens sp.]
MLQISHGMTEHIGRYEKLAEMLTSQGIVVAGFDLRGHGRNGGRSVRRLEKADGRQACEKCIFFIRKLPGVFLGSLIL